MSKEFNSKIFKKSNSSEIINIGDLIMIDINNLSVTKAILAEYDSEETNSALIVGVCIKSNNISKGPFIMDGGSAISINENNINGGLSNKVIRIQIEGDDSSTNSRTEIEVAISGICSVNLFQGVQYEIGDLLTLSDQAGLAVRLDIYERPYYIPRSIGKLIELSLDDKVGKILLDIN